MTITSLCHAWDLKNKTVLVRADLNVPIHEGIITDDFRLQAVVPTIKLLQEKGARIIVATHLGRPTLLDASYSTQPLARWLTAHGLETTHVPLLMKSSRPITLLENLRFFPGEKNNDPVFAQQLASLADYYVNEAFGASHRTDTSLTNVPQLFAPDKRTFGLRFVEEVTALEKITTDTNPKIVCIGGKKVCDKIKLITSLIKKVDTIMIMPALATAFLKAEGKEIGTSYCEDSCLPEASALLKQAPDRIKLPCDYRVAQHDETGIQKIVAADEIGINDYILSCGPETIRSWEKEITQARVVLFNGPMGMSKIDSSQKELKELLTMIAAAPGYTIAAGGDTVAAVRRYGLAEKFDFCSTGGGAALAFISGSSMPGIASILP